MTPLERPFIKNHLFTSDSQDSLPLYNIRNNAGYERAYAQASYMLYYFEDPRLCGPPG